MAAASAYLPCSSMLQAKVRTLLVISLVTSRTAGDCTALRNSSSSTSDRTDVVRSGHATSPENTDSVTDNPIAYSKHVTVDKAISSSHPTNTTESSKAAPTTLINSPDVTTLSNLNLAYVSESRNISHFYTDNKRNGVEASMVRSLNVTDTTGIVSGYPVTTGVNPGYPVTTGVNPNMPVYKLRDEIRENSSVTYGLITISKGSDNHTFNSEVFNIADVTETAGVKNGVLANRTNSAADDDTSAYTKKTIPSADVPTTSYQVTDVTVRRSDVSVSVTNVTNTWDPFRIITTEDITKCLRQNGTLVSSEQDVVLVFQVSDYGVEQMQSKSTCDLHVRVQPEKVVRFWEVSHRNRFCSNLMVSVFDTGSGPDQELVLPTCMFSDFSDTFSDSNKVTIHLASDRTAASGPVFFRLRYTGVTEASRPRDQLEVIFSSSTAGYIQTPGFGTAAGDVATNMDSWSELPVPSDHSVMISFGYTLSTDFSSSCDRKRLAIYQDGDTALHLVDKICQTETFPVSVYHARVLFFRFFWRARLFTVRGFRLLFSLHLRSTLPQKLPDGRWNCSAARDWAPYQQHFPCNAFPECLGHEDEGPCTYTTDSCGPGFLTLAGGCFLYFRDNSKSWNQASKHCLSLGMRLAILNTPQRVEAVRELFEDQLIKRLYVYVGLRLVTATPYTYRNSLIWSDRSIAHGTEGSTFNSTTSCVRWSPRTNNTFKLVACERVPKSLDILPHHFLCEKEAALKRGSSFHEQIPTIASPTASWWSPLGPRFTKCPLRHVTHTFLACDSLSVCWGQGHGTVACDAALRPMPPSFRCASVTEHVPYTLVCDHREDCRDNSDEDFCQFDPCTGSKPFDCGNGQCFPWDHQCDGITQCLNSVDERCPQTAGNQDFNLPPKAAVIRLNTRGELVLHDLKWPGRNDSSSVCEETHFRCPETDVTYCMPVFLRCNGLYDCPGHGDEAACDTYTCPGFYRCRNSRVCVHPSHLCDGLFQCPQHDDELLCDLTCPDTCVCHGHAFFCSRAFLSAAFPNLRFLDGRGSGMSLADVANNTLLIHLSLVNCQIKHLTQLSLPNLRSLDLSENLLNELAVEDFQKLISLQEVTLAGNPLALFFEGDVSHLNPLSSIILLNVSQIKMEDLDVNKFQHMFPALQVFNMSGAGLRRILGNGFSNFTKLHTLDIRGCPLVGFPQNVFEGLQALESVDADNYKLCCPSILPQGFNVLHCRAPRDELSSCEALLRSDVYRSFLSTAAALSLLANLGSMLYRMFVHKQNTGLGFDVFVTNLCLSDFLMGAYLSIIGFADRFYFGIYLWKEEEWKSSAVCKLAGFLSVVSREVSTIIICLITLDRFLALRFPFRPLHFRKRSALAACVVAWLAGIAIALVPLSPSTSHWKFYSQTGICIPLPITRSNFSGRDYSFGIIVVLNFVLFLLIAVGQVFIFWSVRANSMAASDTCRKSKDLTVARRLISVAASNFLCWFPIGLLGLLASNGIPISDEVNVAMAIFVLPINSALNPFLYTINLLLERRRRAQEERMMARIKREMQTTLTKNENSSSPSQQA